MLKNFFNIFFYWSKNYPISDCSEFEEFIDINWKLNNEQTKENNIMNQDILEEKYFLFINDFINKKKVDNFKDSIKINKNDYLKNSLTSKTTNKPESTLNETDLLNLLFFANISSRSILSAFLFF